MWEAVETISDPSPEKHTEDLAGRHGSVAWMLDGASAVSDKRVAPDHPSDAYWLVQRLDAALRQLADDETATLPEIVAGAIKMTAAWANQEWRDEPEIPPSAALGIIRRTGDDTEWLILADVSIIFLLDPPTEEVDLRVEDGLEEVRNFMRARLDDGHPVHEVKARTRPQLLAHRRAAMNKADGYWVASLDEGVVDHARTGTVSGAHEVIMATDGFMRVLRPFRLIDHVSELFRPECRLDAMARMVRAAESADPHLSYTRWTEWDDICAQRLRWVPQLTPEA